MQSTKTSAAVKSRSVVLAAEPEVEGKDRSQYLSRAVKKSLELLELLQGQPSPMTLNEIARQIKLSKTSAFRLLCTLESVGYLVHDSASQYGLVPEIRRPVSSRFLIRLMQAASPIMQDLSRNLRETISVAALFENRVEVIAVEESPETIRMCNVIGHIVPPNASSLGKVITAFQSDERREKLLRSFGLYRFTPQTITDRAELRREFERVRQQGFAADREESVSDGYCFAVPIMSKNGEVPAGISLSLPSMRMRSADDPVEHFIKALRDAAKEISAVL
jgi:DNA-binding IclR family transcriptional regulator